MNTKLNFKKIITTGLIAGGISTIVNSILFYSFHTLGIISDSIQIQPNTPLTVVPIIISSILPSLIGSIVFYLFEKYSSNGFKLFSIISSVLVLLSFISPFANIPNVTTGYAIALNVMHLVVAFNLLFLIRKKVKSKN